MQNNKIQNSGHVIRYKKLYTLGIPDRKDSQKIVDSDVEMKNSIIDFGVNRRRIFVDYVRAKLKL